MADLQSYVRLAVPKAPGSAFGDSSYLRLGTYTSGDESSLSTGLSTTTSSVTDTGEGAAQQAQDKLTDTSKPANTWDATSQQADKYKTGVTATTASSNNGVLIYSNSDLNENIKGAALQKFGKGHTTEVTTADAKYSVKAGQYQISAQNGVFITGGASGAPANIELTAYGYVKQTAYGPLDQITYGLTRKQFIGSAFSFFLGDNWSCTMGMTTSLTMGLSTACFIGVSFTLKLSLDFSLTASATVTIKFFAENKLLVGSKLDITVGNEFKQVTGNSMKIVIGPDTKFATSDLKVLQLFDVKFAASGDIKKVGINGTFCDIDVKVTAADIANNKLKADQAQLVASLKSIKAEQGTAEVKSKAAILHL